MQSTMQTDRPSQFAVKLGFQPLRTRILFGFAALLMLSACNVDLYSHLDERQANEMVAALIENGISANRVFEKDKSVTITVDKAQFAEAVTLLNNLGLPREKFASIADVFPADNLISSPLQERARLTYALSQELSHTVSDIDGVLSARVHLVMPESDDMQKSSTPASAAVFIRCARSASVDTAVPQIKTLIANSVAGVTYDRVTVVLVPVGATGQDPLPHTAAVTPGGGPAFAAASFNDYWPLGLLGLVAVAGSGAVFHRRHRVQRATVKLDPV